MYFLHQKKYFYLQLWCHNALWHHSHDWLTWVGGRLPGVLGYRRGLRGLWGWLMGRLWGCLGPALGTTLWVLVAWWGITPRSWWVASTTGGRGVTGRGSIVWWGSSCCTTWGGGLWYVCPTNCEKLCKKVEVLLVLIMCIFIWVVLCNFMFIKHKEFPFHPLGGYGNSDWRQWTMYIIPLSPWNYLHCITCV